MTRPRGHDGLTSINVAPLSVVASGSGLAYGLPAAGIVWSVSAIIAGNRADGMAGISDVVLGGVLLWVLVVPAGVACLLMEYRKRGSGPRSARH